MSSFTVVYSGLFMYIWVLLKSKLYFSKQKYNCKNRVFTKNTEDLAIRISNNSIHITAPHQQDDAVLINNYLSYLFQDKKIGIHSNYSDNLSLRINYRSI